ncbi:MAG TPA: tetratricopeptide repeat protein [Pyrinomonadaceae bacterium]|nr:tetratricopeptide repeat protein [Pyrinomonadaceae bacterium]
MLALFFVVVITSAHAVAQVDNLVKQLEHAAALITDNRDANAEKELTSILRVAPNEPAALNLLGTIRAKQGRLPEAEKFFLRAVRGDYKYVAAHMNLAHLYMLMGQPNNTISELKKVLLLDPGNAEALERLARLLMARGAIDEGIKALEDSEQSQPLSVKLLLLLGDAYLKQGKAAKAEARFQLALDQQSEETDAVLGLAQVSLLKRDANTASQFLQRARKMVATSPDTLYRFALVALGAGLYEEANGTLLAAIRLNPNDPAYFLALGTTWIKKPDLLEAEQAFRRALHLQPDNPTAQMYLGYALLEQKKYPEARHWLEKSLQKDKSVPETFFYLGQIAQEQNDDLGAIGFFKQAIALDRSYSFAHAGLGASYLRLKNYALAQQALELSVRLNPNDAKAHYNLAVLFARLKNPERAQEHMQVVEKLKNAKPNEPAGAKPFEPR